MNPENSAETNNDKKTSSKVTTTTTTTTKKIKKSNKDGTGLETDEEINETHTTHVENESSNVSVTEKTEKSENNADVPKSEVVKQESKQITESTGKGAKNQSQQNIDKQALKQTNKIDQTTRDEKATPPLNMSLINQKKGKDESLADLVERCKTLKSARGSSAYGLDQFLQLRIPARNYPSFAPTADLTNRGSHSRRRQTDYWNYGKRSDLKLRDPLLEPVRLAQNFGFSPRPTTLQVLQPQIPPLINLDNSLDFQFDRIYKNEVLQNDRQKNDGIPTYKPICFCSKNNHINPFQLRSLVERIGGQKSERLRETLTSRRPSM